MDRVKQFGVQRNTVKIKSKPTQALTSVFESLFRTINWFFLEGVTTKSRMSVRGKQKKKSSMQMLQFKDHFYPNTSNEDLGVFRE